MSCDFSYFDVVMEGKGIYCVSLYGDAFLMLKERREFILISWQLAWLCGSTNGLDVEKEGS